MEFTNLQEIDGFKKVHVECKVSEAAPIEKVEFINGTLFDQENFEYSKEYKIDYSRIIDKMLDIFKLMKGYIEERFK